MKGKRDVLQKYSIQYSEVSVDGMITELSRAECKESAKLSNQARSFCHFVINQGDNGAENFKPSSLKMIHLILYLQPTILYKIQNRLMCCLTNNMLLLAINCVDIYQNFLHQREILLFSFLKFINLFFHSIKQGKMSQSDTGSSQQQAKTKQQVTSLRKQCLDSLRFPVSSNLQKQRPKTHLLACMSQFNNDQPQIKAQQIDDFCCFDRMKRIIEKRKMADPEKNKNKQPQSSQNQRLLKFVQIQAKMKKMQHNLMKYVGDKNQKVFISEGVKKKKSFQNDPSLSNLFLTSPVDQQWKDSVVTQNGQNKTEIQNLPGRHSMKKKIRQQGYKQYLQWQKKKLADSQNDVKEFIQTQIQQKVKTMLEQRDIKFNELLKQTKNLQRSILQKNLEIQNLKTKQQSLMKNVRELQSFKDLFSQQNTIKNKNKQAILQNFYQQFSEEFPNQTIKSLRKYISTITDKCLQKFNDVQCKRFDKWNEEKLDMNERINKLENIIQKFKTNQNQLLNNLKQFRYEQSVATMQMDSLLKNKTELQKLQKKILSLYNDWYGNLSESEKQLMKNLGYLQGSYQYEEMLEYIVVFKNKFSTDTKVNDYLIKILRGIQRIRKILFPRTVSTPGYKQQMMDPIFILQKLQKYIKSKVFQIQKRGNCIQKGSRMSQLIEQQFLGVQQHQTDNVVQSPLFLKSKQNQSQLIKKHGSLNFNKRSSSPAHKNTFHEEPSNKFQRNLISRQDQKQNIKCL